MEKLCFRLFRGVVNSAFEQSSRHYNQGISEDFRWKENRPATAASSERISEPSSFYKPEWHYFYCRAFYYYLNSQTS